MSKYYILYYFIAAGLYYLAELVEEYTVYTAKVIRVLTVVSREKLYTVGIWGAVKQQNNSFKQLYLLDSKADPAYSVISAQASSDLKKPPWDLIFFNIVVKYL